MLVHAKEVGGSGAAPTAKNLEADNFIHFWAGRRPPLQFPGGTCSVASEVENVSCDREKAEL